MAVLRAARGGNVPFQFDITRYLKNGANTVTVRADDPPADATFARQTVLEAKSASIFYTRTSGIWQTVWLEAAGESYLTGVHITPGNDGSVRLDAALRGPRPISSLWRPCILKGAGWRRAPWLATASR